MNFMPFILQISHRPIIELRDVIAFCALILGLFNLFFGPKYQKKLEKKKEANSRRVNVFKILMATRGARLSYRHVEALNTVDLEFFEPEYAPIIVARNNYYDNLSNRNEDPNSTATWLDKNDELLSTLLYEMSKMLKYGHSLVDIKRKVYTPQAHINAEEEDMAIRKGMVALLQNKEGYLPVYFQQDEEATTKATDRQNQLQDLMMEYYSRRLEKLNPNKSNA